MAALRILILSDGRPGHFNLSEGIAAAVGRLGPVTVARVDVRRGRWPGLVLAGLAKAPLLGPSTMLKRVYGLAAAALPAADLVVSAGAETLAANVWVARERGIANVFYGSLRQFTPTDFSLVLTSYARNAGRPRHMLALKPSAFDPDTLGALPSSLGRKRPENTGQPIDSALDITPPPAPLPGRGDTLRSIALLIGGNAGTFRYAEADWARLLAFVEATHRDRRIVWQVSNSRRTPAEVSDRLAEMAARVGSGIARFVDVRRAGSGTLAELLGAADAVLCTDDSSSMISECIWAMRPVLGVAPTTYHHTADEGAYRDWLASNGWCRRVAIAELTPDAMLAQFAALTPLESNPLDQLAARLAEALPVLRR